MSVSKELPNVIENILNVKGRKKYRLTAQVYVFCILAYPVYTVHMVRGKEHPGQITCL